MDTINAVQNVIIENRKRLNLSGVKDVLSFDDETIILDTILGYREAYRAYNSAIGNREVGNILPLVSDSRLSATEHCIECSAEVEVIPQSKGWHKTRCNIS